MPSSSLGSSISSALPLLQAKDTYGKLDAYHQIALTKSVYCVHGQGTTHESVKPAMRAYTACGAAQVDHVEFCYKRRPDRQAMFHA